VITIDLNRLKIEPGKKVLDVGCGTGRHSCAVSRFEGVLVVGVDINHDGLMEAHRKLELEKEFNTFKARWCEFIVSDICSLPFEDMSFDLVICSEVLEHVANASRALGELARVLKPCGDLAISVPRSFPERICWKLSSTYHSESGGHLRIYTKNDLKAAVEKKGLTHWATHFAHGLHTPYWWLKCLVGADNGRTRLVDLYHNLLVWDIMKKPRITRLLDSLLTPVMGKSIVMYFRKDGDVCS